MNRRSVLQQITLLMGGMLSGPTLMALETSDFNAREWSDLSEYDSNAIDIETLAEITEMIIPRTNTAGAKDAQVPAFIVRMIRNCYTQQDQESFGVGLAQLKSQGFATQTVAGKTNMLKALEQSAKSAYPSYAKEQSLLSVLPYKERIEKQTIAIPFWKLVKELTLLGYFTSEICMQESFDYIPIPGKLELVKYKKGQKLYAY